MVRVRKVGGSIVVTIPIDLDVGLPQGMEVNPIPLKVNGVDGIAFLPASRIPKVPKIEVPDLEI